MAWFFASEAKDFEQDILYAPRIRTIPEEVARFAELGMSLAAKLLDRADAEHMPMDCVDYPSWGPGKFPSVLNGWRWPMPDRPLRVGLARQEGAIVDIVNAGFSWGISERVINMIEKIEPGVHQYLPFEFIQPDGSVHPDRRWVLNICTRVEAVDMKRSNVQWMAPPLGFLFINKPGDWDIVVKAEEARRRAIWFEWRYHKFGYQEFASDVLWDALQCAGVRGWAPNRNYPRHIEEV